MQSYTTNNSNLLDNARLEIDRARTWNPEPARLYISPEAKKMQEVGQAVDWLRQAALISNDYNRKRVDELLPANNKYKSIVDSFNQLIFGSNHQASSAYDQTIQLLHTEAKLGGEFFGGDSSTTTHQFFSFTPDKWIYFGHEVTGLLKSQDTMINYDIHGGNIRKSVDGNILSMSQEEADNLMLVFNSYVSYIGTSLYPTQYKILLDWQEAQQASQASTLGEVDVRHASSVDQVRADLDERRFNYLNTRYDDVNQSDALVLAS